MLEHIHNVELYVPYGDRLEMKALCWVILGYASFIRLSYIRPITWMRLRQLSTLQRREEITRIKRFLQH